MISPGLNIHANECHWVTPCLKDTMYAVRGPRHYYIKDNGDDISNNKHIILLVYSIHFIPHT